MDLDLANRGVLITGASGGIGSATATAFAAEGARVVVHYFRNQERAEQLAADIGGLAVQADLRDPVSTAALVARAADHLGVIDVCVANSGSWDQQALPIWEITPERFQRTIEDNLTATFLTCREYLLHVKDTGRGNVVLVSSVSASLGEVGNSDYAAAKAAIAYGFARTLKNEIVRIAPEGRVNVVAPGWTLTGTVSAAMDDAALERATATRPLKTLPAPEDVASTILWLASPTAARHLSGSVVDVAGGMEGRLVNVG